MRNTLLSVVILCLASPSLVFSRHPEKNLNERVTAYMENLQHRGEFSGVVLLARDGKILFARGYGMANWSMMFQTPSTPSFDLDPSPSSSPQLESRCCRSGRS